MKSICCHADAKVVPENAHRGQTCYYECQKCKEPCDVIEEIGLNPVVTSEMVDRLTVNLIEQVKRARRETEIEVVKNICILIDEIELSEPDSTLAEWKQYKHIRNAIRDFYGIVPDRANKKE